jgi:uncharacterized protein
MKPVYRSNLFMLIVVLGQIFGSFFLSKPLYKLFQYDQILVLSQIIFLLIPVIIYLIVAKVSLKDTLKLNKISFKDGLTIIAIAIISQPIATFLSALSSMFFRNVINDLFREMGNISYITQLGIVAFTPAICEELTMRGVILSGYDKVGRSKAAVATGFLFGILHMNLQQFFYAFALGVLFAYLVRITNSIFSTILCHFTFNGIQVTMSFAASRLNPEIINQAGELANLSIKNKIALLVPYFIWAAVCTYVLIWIIKKMEQRHEERQNKINTQGYDSEVYGTMPHLIRRYSSHKEERIINGPFIAVTVIFILMMILMKYLR